MFRDSERLLAHADRKRQLAERCRALAADLDDKDAADTFFRYAEQLEETARNLEAKAGPPEAQNN